MSSVGVGQGDRRAAKVARGIVLVLLTIAFLIPFYLLVRDALSTDQQINNVNGWTWFPSNPQWHNLIDAFNDPSAPLGRSMLNSLFIAVTQTVGVLVISGMAGYGLARIRVRYASAVFYVVLATLLIPAAVTFVPSFVMVSTLGWVSTLRGLIVPGLFQALATFLFRQYFLGFPKELEEAAQIDGAGPWRTFWRIVVPNSWSFVAAIATITFIGSWNAFLWPLVIGQDQNSWTVQITLSTYATAQSINLHGMFMAALISMVPLLLMFLFLQRWIVAGVEQTGINE
ncbi:carbohydrate ABC transporter permease [Calidifontibacter sp. DB0510]|uniref:Carbohydrate ABC transporter permease n=1 Tax=Metallococcus carri TaxID=1656884 RepID=A0A967B2D7_9MICO|nr:carbohydrate ABC transporter permease [Metallococcus carri]NHN56020.1 carbohydrate ABC transporter permease [Metallococcus carri]NOP37523.1 carbohydrate ABC transporter permease [Calidifontibacter sp. DB2511S]